MMMKLPLKRQILLVGEITSPRLNEGNVKGEKINTNTLVECAFESLCANVNFHYEN